MTAPLVPKTFLASTATGLVIPYTMQDLRQTLSALGHRVWVQDNASLRTRDEKILSMIDGLVQVEPDALLTIDHVGILPEVLCLLDRVPTVISWIYDDPRHFIKPNFLLVNSHLHLFCWDRAYLPYLQGMGFAHCDYQPFATNAAVNQPNPGADYEFDVSFVGAFSPPRGELLCALAARGIRVDVFGDEGWRQVKEPNVHYHGIADNRRDGPRIYSRSKINLNITSPQLLTALPVRVFDVLGCEGFLLTDRREDVGRLFDEGRELVVYENPEDLLKKIRHYLERADERDAIRRSGRARVLQSYTFERMVPLMLEKAFAASADLSCNTPPAEDTAARYLWVVGTSYLKFGKLRQAFPRLMDALRLNPRSGPTLMSLALLAHVSGQPDSLSTCLDSLRQVEPALADWAAEVAAAGDQAIQPDWWQRLYAGMFPGMRVQADGTVAGWTPRRESLG